MEFSEGRAFSWVGVLVYRGAQGRLETLQEATSAEVPMNVGGVGRVPVRARPAAAVARTPP